MAVRSGVLIVKALVAIASMVMLAGATPASSKTPSKKAAVTQEPPMRIYLVRSSQEGCEPHCPEWIAAQGRIEVGSLGRLKAVLNQIGGRNVPLLIHSGGGMADEALAMGRLLRARRLDVAVGKTVFTPCAPEQAACRKSQAGKPLHGHPDTEFSVCASSCAFILAAGTRRYVGFLSLVGVHRSILIQAKVLQTYKMTPYRAGDGSVKYKRKLISEKVVSQRQVSAPQRTYERYEKYFGEMGVGKAIMPLMLAAESTSIHWLTQGELRSTRIATHRMNGAELINGSTALQDGWPVPPAPVVSGPRLSQPPQDCTRSGLACVWKFLPAAPPGGAGTPAPSR
jgi:hypothetical protein